MKNFIAILILMSGVASAQTIICPPDAPTNVKLAAKEIRRYVYLRNGKLLPIAHGGTGISLKIDPTLGTQEYRITADTIAGGSDIGVLYGAYRYAELLGVRFYLHGDVIPDEPLKELPVIKEETGKPLFALRGINSWGYHPHGMDAWGADDYQAIITQLAKMRMNFIGIHCYPYRNDPAPATAASGELAGFSSSTSEPTVWHGLASSFDAKGRVNISYPTLYYSSAHPKRYGGYGCNGLMGLHWRSDILAPNISALAQAGWDQSWDNPAAWTVTGEVARYPNAAITGTPDAPLYRSCRFDLKTIRLPVPAGKYKVTLKFCEPYFDAANQRICDVQIQGNTVLTNLDIFAKVGKFAALDYTFDDIAAADGMLTIELIARKSLPCISAIAVEGKGFTRKINCGGAAYNDWQADGPKPRSLPVDDFYADFAQTNFGSPAVGKIFARIDG